MGFDDFNSFPIFLGTLLTSVFIITSNTPAASADCNSNKNDDVHLSTPEECSRECFEGAPPKTCYYNFTLEVYTTLGGACAICPFNETTPPKSDCQCVTADGYERSFLAVNRQLPGPSIHVCKGDLVVIDVKNNMDGTTTTIHWHGILQKGSQYYDGVPMVTQCPITHGTTFRYQWRADNEGTHFYHAHDGSQKLDGINGKLTVRTPLSVDPNSYRYDFDLTDHEIMLTDWMHDYTTEHIPGNIKRSPGQSPVSALINGKGRWTDPVTGNTTKTPLAEFVVRTGFRYRMRIINSFCSTCPAELIFEGHTVILIAVDGVPISPTKINTIISFAGERFDVILEADQLSSAYWIQLRGLGGCARTKIQQLAILRYEGYHDRTCTAQPTYDSSLPKGITLSPLDGLCNITRPDAVCFNHLTSAHPVDKRIRKGQSDIKLFLPVGFYSYPNEELFKPNTYKRFSVPGGTRGSAGMMDNITFAFAPSPPLSQIHDLPKTQFCNKDNRPNGCGFPCMCTHKVDIPLHSVVELIVIDGVGIPGISHPFHLHGHAFNVISMGVAPYEGVTKMNAYQARRMDHDGLIHRRFTKPPFKDTIPIPTGGFIVVRFLADNPGYWLFHCHFLFHHLVGMEMLLHVGNDDTDLPPVPDGFPTCGNHLGKIRGNKSKY